MPNALGNNQKPFFPSFSENAAMVNETREEPKKEPQAPRPPKPKTTAPQSKPSRGRKKKSTEAAGSDGKNKKLLGFYLDTQDHFRLKLACMNRNVSMTELVTGVTMDALEFTYVCTNPACRSSFVMRSSVEGDPEKPNHCPCCNAAVSRQE